MLQVEGGSFGTTMNPAQLTNTTVGEISLVFADDQRGTVHFRVGGRTGEYAIERLTRLQTGAGARGVSGSWYQHAYRGQGLIVQETGADGLLAVLFSFAADGKPAWAVLQGTLLANGEISFASAPMRTRGGLFGRGFRNASVTRTSEGNANLNLACNSGSLTIRLPSISAASHTLTLERLTRPLGIVCP